MPLREILQSAITKATSVLHGVCLSSTDPSSLAGNEGVMRSGQLRYNPIANVHKRICLMARAYRQNFHQQPCRQSSQVICLASCVKPCGSSYQLHLPRADIHPNHYASLVSHSTANPRHPGQSITRSSITISSLQKHARYWPPEP